MFADDILTLDFDDSSVRKKLEVYNYGLTTAKQGNILDFDRLKDVLHKISSDEEEKNILQAEFIKGFSDGFQ